MEQIAGRKPLRPMEGLVTLQIYHPESQFGFGYRKHP